MTKEELKEMIKEHKKTVIACGVGAVLLIGAVGTGVVLSAQNNDAVESSKAIQQVKKDNQDDKKPIIDSNKSKKDNDKSSEADTKDANATDITKNIDTENKNNKESDKKDTATVNAGTKKTEISKKDNSTASKPQEPTKSNKPAEPEKPVNPPKPQEPEKPVHTHSWEQQYVTQDQGYWDKQLVKEAWVEEVPVTEMQERCYCSKCHEDITDGMIANGGSMVFHVEQYHPDWGGRWYSDWKEVTVRVDKIPHDAEYKDVWIPNVVQVPNGYKCACGAIKEVS